MNKSNKFAIVDDAKSINRMGVAIYFMVIVAFVGFGQWVYDVTVATTTAKLFCEISNVTTVNLCDVSPREFGMSESCRLDFIIEYHLELIRM